jgi:hypothetical protein
MDKMLIKGMCKLIIVAHAYNPRYFGGKGRKITSSRPAQARVSVTLSQKQNTKKRAEGMTQVKSTCLACVRPWVPSLLHRKKKGKCKKRSYML